MKVVCGSKSVAAVVGILLICCQCHFVATQTKNNSASSVKTGRAIQGPRQNRVSPTKLVPHSHTTSLDEVDTSDNSESDSNSSDDNSDSAFDNSPPVGFSPKHSDITFPTDWPDLPYPPSPPVANRDGRRNRNQSEARPDVEAKPTKPKTNPDKWKSVSGIKNLI